MTDQESSAIKRLEDRMNRLEEKIDMFQDTIKALTVQQDIGLEAIKEINRTLFGLPGDDRSKGVVSQVLSLLESRVWFRWSLQAIWTLIVALVGAQYHSWFGR